jgi:hypothetical protein
MNPDWNGIVQALASNDETVKYKAKKTLLDACLRASAEEKAKIASFLAGELAADKPDAQKGKKRPGRDISQNAKHPLQVRIELARALSLVASENNLTDLLSAAADLDVGDAVRMVLERSPGEKITEALISLARTGVGTEFRAGAVNALGFRNGSATLEALKELSVDADRTVALAACDALARHADATVDAALQAATAKIRGKQQGKIGPAGPAAQIVKARLRHAGTLAKSGNADGAKKIYQDVLAITDAKGPKKAAESALGGTA